MKRGMGKNKTMPRIGEAEILFLSVQERGLTTPISFCAFLMPSSSSSLSSSSSNKLNTFLAWVLTSFSRAGGDVANRSELLAGSEDVAAKGSTKKKKNTNTTHKKNQPVI